jgi:hypothetical protein
MWRDDFFLSAFGGFSNFGRNRTIEIINRAISMFWLLGLFVVLQMIPRSSRARSLVVVVDNLFMFYAVGLFSNYLI